MRLAPSKRGDLLALDLARLSTLAPGHRRVGLSATVTSPSCWRAISCRSCRRDAGGARGASGRRGPSPIFRSWRREVDVPWAGHHGAPCASARFWPRSKRAKTALVFVNTRMQAEFVFQQLWAINGENLPIALHHGSLVARAAAQGRGGDDEGRACAPSCAPRRSISASIGARSIS